MSRFETFVLPILVVGGLFLPVILFWMLPDMASFVEVQRHASPDGRLDAVVVESNGGATTDYGYFVCVVPRGESCDHDDAVAMTYGAWCGPRARGVETRWDGPTALRVVYKSTRRSELRVPAPRVDGRTVSIALVTGRCGAQDATGA